MDTQFTFIIAFFFSNIGSFIYSCVRKDTKTLPGLNTLIEVVIFHRDSIDYISSGEHNHLKETVQYGASYKKPA